MKLPFPWAEHRRRLLARQAMQDYDPIKGLRDDLPFDDLTDVMPQPRVQVTITSPGGGTFMIPRSMYNDPEFSTASQSMTHWEKLRCRHDFEFWCARCVTIRDKLTGRYIPFFLNRAQRHVTDILESQRLAGKPMRLILLKARQWGGSTLVQMYMAWIQTCLATNIHSLICAHVKDTSKSILGMYSTMLDSYPPDLWQGEGEARAFRPFERSTNIRTITGRGCRVTVSSAECQEALRGSDIALAHLSEVAFWPSTPAKSPADYMRTVNGTVGLTPMTLVALESTANGTGNYFHDEWQRCVAGKGDKTPVFVPWYRIDMYAQAITEDEGRQLWETLTDYERDLWYNHGLDLEQIAWYRAKLKEFPTPDAMHAEFPTTPTEAFVNSGANVFRAEDIQAMRSKCLTPREDENEPGLMVWATPSSGHEYIVTVDIGGRSARSDYSVVAVLDRQPPMTVCAQWRGHIDHDLLGELAMRVATTYNEALLVVESNTLETADESLSGAGVLDTLARQYPNLYYRPASDSTIPRPGLHTNRSTKAHMIDLLIRAVRTAGTSGSDWSVSSLPCADLSYLDIPYYIERDNEACNEFASYICLPNGSYSAPYPKHDDILMTRAMALYVANQEPPQDPTISSITSRAQPWRIRGCL
ncbi:MAG: hypothetical protein J6C44_10555 [Muribaculaceae bacterium]|nr:hypothetical protein [Muribaculaceae bacterium]